MLKRTQHEAHCQCDREVSLALYKSKDEKLKIINLEVHKY